jgi:hypothetical protein
MCGRRPDKKNGPALTGPKIYLIRKLRSVASLTRRRAKGKDRIHEADRAHRCPTRDDHCGCEAATRLRSLAVPRSGGGPAARGRRDRRRCCRPCGARATALSYRALRSLTPTTTRRDRGPCACSATARSRRWRQALELRLLKKSMIGDGGDQT